MARVGFDRTDLEGQHELIDVACRPDLHERRADVESDVGHHRGLDPLTVKAAEHRGGIRVRRPVHGVDQQAVERFGLIVGNAGLAQHVQVGLSVQVRRKIAVDPCVVRLRRHIDVLAGGRGHPAHDFGLHMPVDLTLVDPHALEPAVVLFEAEQGA